MMRRFCDGRETFRRSRGPEPEKMRVPQAAPSRFLEKRSVLDTTRYYSTTLLRQQTPQENLCENFTAQSRHERVAAAIAFDLFTRRGAVF